MSTASSRSARTSQRGSRWAPSRSCPEAGLQIGTSGSPVAANALAEIVIADRPVDTGIDPEQYGTGLLGFGRVTMHGSVKSPTFVRLAAEANAGQASLSLSAGVAGWHGGDRLVVPGTNQTSQMPIRISPSGRHRRSRRPRARAWRSPAGSRSRTAAAATPPARSSSCRTSATSRETSSSGRRIPRARADTC